MYLFYRRRHLIIKRQDNFSPNMEIVIIGIKAQTQFWYRCAVHFTAPPRLSLKVQQRQTQRINVEKVFQDFFNFMKKKKKAAFKKVCVCVPLAKSLRPPLVLQERPHVHYLLQVDSFRAGDFHGQEHWHFSLLYFNPCRNFSKPSHRRFLLEIHPVPQAGVDHRCPQWDETKPVKRNVIS